MLRIGQFVKFVSPNPVYGRGGVKIGEVGVVTQSHGGEIVVDFPGHHRWNGRANEVVRVNTPTKHLKYTAYLVKPELSVVRVKFLKQTHRNEAFGDEGSEFSHEGFKLISAACPAGGYRDHAFVRGHSRNSDEDEISIRAEYYPAFKAAVEAYNAKFSGEGKEDVGALGMSYLSKGIACFEGAVWKTKEPWQRLRKEAGKHFYKHKG